MTTQNLILAGAAVLFVVFLLWNGLRTGPLRRTVRRRLASPEGADEELEALLEKLRAGAKSGPVLLRIKDRVCDEPDPAVRAVWLCAAGNVLRNTLSRKAAATRYYKAALGEDPTCREARLGLRDLLLGQRRALAAEQVYWRLLGRLEPAEHGPELVCEVWGELAGVLERRRTGRVRAVAIRRLLAQLERCPAPPVEDEPLAEDEPEAEDEPAVEDEPEAEDEPAGGDEPA